MAVRYVSTQVDRLINQAGPANTGGLAGAPSLNRATENRGRIKAVRFNVAQASPVAQPGTTAGTFATGDSFIIALLDPTTFLYLGRIRYNNWGGTSVTVKAGRVNPNLTTAVDETGIYLAATTGLSSAAGQVDFNLVIPDQVGADPAGDLSTDNNLPGYGAQKIQIVLTIGGTLGAGGTLTGFLFIVE
jgi:hypothetical protein